jgi:hypothetical protein
MTVVIVSIASNFLNGRAKSGEKNFKVLEIKYCRRQSLLGFLSFVFNLAFFPFFECFRKADKLKITSAVLRVPSVINTKVKKSSQRETKSA